MKVKCFTAEGLKAGEVNLPSAVFKANYKTDLIYRVLESEKTNRRQGTHHTKTRSEVSGGGKKPWKQKGTGNARQGSIRVPHWKGGGVALGPRSFKPYSLLPHKMRKLGILSIFSSKAKEGVISVVKGFDINEYSTKKLSKMFKAMGLEKEKNIVILNDVENKFLSKSLSNLPNVTLLNSNRITAPELFYASSLLIVESAINQIEKRFEKLSKPKKVAV